jgi:hypothetical protein
MLIIISTSNKQTKIIWKKVYIKKNKKIAETIEYTYIRKWKTKCGLHRVPTFSTEFWT